MTTATNEPPLSSSKLTGRILPYVLMTFACYLAIGVQLAILPSYVHLNLGFSTVLAGLIISMEYVATVVTRPQAGRMVDRLGAKRTVLCGLATGGASGVLMVASALCPHLPWLSLSLLVAAIIVVGVVRIVREACDVLLESAPDHAQVPLVRRSLRTLPGVVDVHDLHVWTIGPGSHALSAHVLLEDARISEASALLRSIEALLHDEFGIAHVTIQFECENCAADERIICTQARARH